MLGLQCNRKDKRSPSDKERNTPKQNLISTDFLPVTDRIDTFAHNI